MSIRIALTHKTSYTYDTFISLSPHVIRLRPAPHCKTNIISYSLEVEPEKQFINWLQDPFGNYMARVVFLEKTKKLSVNVDLVAELKVINPFDFFIEPNQEFYPFGYPKELKKELSPYLVPSEDGNRLKKFVKKIKREKIKTTLFLVHVNQMIYEKIKYLIRMEPGVQSCETTLETLSGSCRDSAYLLVQVLRYLGLAARFVSGYLIQLKPDVKPIDGPEGPKEDFTDLHAWAEVYLPGAGWVGLDPTSGLLTGEGHIPLAATPEPQNAAAIYGFTDPAKVEFAFEMKIERIHETPRVTYPYTEKSWNRLLKLGEDVEKRIQKNDIRLTIGGEPTFVAKANMEDPEWNFEALGENKYILSEKLLWNLKDTYTKGGLLQFCQGKWYPGEALPRWAMHCYWRKDGKVIISDDNLFKANNKTYTLEDANILIKAIAKELEIDPSFCIPGFEDTMYYLWKERNLPQDFTLELKDQFDKLERKRIMEVLERGILTERGYALPVKYNFTSNRFESTKWIFKTEKMFLVPGNSPMGLRLPLKSLADKMEQPFYEIDQMDKLDALKTKEEFLKQDPNAIYSSPYNPSYSPNIFTAICVEPDFGKLKIFLPPCNFLEQWLELIYKIEKVATELNIKIQLEGYEPPKDQRLEEFRITPDPGVIEVNLHPSSSWSEMVNKTDILYKEAEKIGLATEKFMTDGRHTGTGGGNHITIGATSPNDSPFFRNKELLPSLITYWQHHPSLSYLFSGLFVGPTSQSPRPDEGKEDALYELEIALNQIQNNSYSPPWLVDRLLRNILMDITGNNHRTEICIDKLFPTDSYSRRLGLIELRAFEMPPHYQMSLAQQLFILALLTRLWEEPYQHKLVRWGTGLHDKYMLPHYVWKDFSDILDDLNNKGFAFLEEDFKAFFEFRFPIYGMTQLDDIKIELRMALEPWYVLGDELTSLGVSRSVDSAVERIEVKISGLTNERYVLSCNGYEVPLASTGKFGEAVAGVRFKAWNPPFTLHPNIQINSPLTFDLYDTWNNRSIGGCTYHVSHPGGTFYHLLPINSFEAESRRISRFWSHGHTQGIMNKPIKIDNPEFPHTLDLRKIKSN